MLPVSLVGEAVDNVHWETILRAVSANRSYRWVNKGAVSPNGIASFLILDRSMPRSLAFCQWEIAHVLKQGLHEFISDFLAQNRALAMQIEKDYSFYP